jgi:localization factor PodJL
VKGIDPKAREIAKDLARRSGMTLGEWLNQMILEDGGSPEPEPVQRLSVSVSPQALSTAYAAPRRSVSMGAGEVEAMLEALERLSSRVEAAEHRSTLAINSIDQSVVGVLQRLETAEREQAQVAARFEGAIDETRTDQARISERLRRMEQEATGHRSAEAMRALESALNKVAGHLYEGETRTREAIEVLRRDLDQISQKATVADADSQTLVDVVVARIADRLERAEAGASTAISSLESSFSSLDARLRDAEANLDPGPAQQKLDQLAEDLSRQIEQVRQDLAAQVGAASDDRIDQLDASLRAMAEQVQQGEQRSARTLEKIGRDVLQIADSFNQKIQASDHRNADAIDQLGADVQRMANVVEEKLQRADVSQAEALEKLGAEIARITERLSERIASAERRSAQAIDDVGEQMARVSERINQRQERSSSELLDRMRQSEERTARLLDEARERIDRRLGDVSKAAGEPDSTPIRSSTFALPDPEPATPNLNDPFAGTPFAAGYDPFGASPFGDNLFASKNEEEPHQPFVELDDTFPVAAASAIDKAQEPTAFLADFPPEPEPLVADFPAEPEPQGFAADEFGSKAFADETPDYASPPFEPSTFESLADKPLAHEPPRYHSPVDHLSIGDPVREPESPTGDFDAAPTRGASTRDLIAAARAAARQASQPPEKEKKERGGPFGHFGKKREHNSVRNAMLASGAVAVLGLSAAGYVLYRPDLDKGDETSKRGAQPATPAQGATQTAPLAANLTTDMTAASPDMGADSSQAASTAAAAAADQSDLYNQAKDKIKAGDKAGLDAMRKVADQGYAPAEFYMAKLYEDGDAGVKKDMVEARRWTQRASDAGDPKAMHNLGLYYFHGDGGTKNVAMAASWFRRAADLGLVDSQYNLAQLYEQGLGVSQNPAEAYKWFLIAAKSGDGESKASAVRLKGELSFSAQQAAERAADAFRAESAAPPAQTAAAAPPALDADKASLAMAQQALSKLGYYKGPADGANSPALRLAIGAYQRTLGETVDGTLTPDLMSKFSAITAKTGSPG